MRVKKSRRVDYCPTTSGWKKVHSFTGKTVAGRFPAQIVTRPELLTLFRAYLFVINTGPSNSPPSSKTFSESMTMIDDP